MRGKVYLVGAGPGDPELLTIKGARCLAEADVIIYDRLVDDRLIDGASSQGELIYVGKKAGQHTLDQSKINELLIAKASEGKIVVRLKGGDPFIFGRGGEEAESLVKAGIPFEVVPGVSAATAVPAYAGIPVTHRSMASSVAIITGHEDPTKVNSNIAWDKLSTGVDTLVFLMGMGNLEQIVEQLINNGRAPSTPIAIIREGTSSRQQTLVGTLTDIAAKASERGFESPALIVVGEVVRLREQLRWFDNQPLFGKRVLVTRSRKQASALSRLLARHGALPVELPTIEVQAISDNPALDQAITHLREYSWLIFTSANGVEIFFGRLRELGGDSRDLGGIKLCVIGPATAAALGRYGLVADCIPPEYVAGEIATCLKEENIAGRRILIPRAESVPPELASKLTQLGAKVEELALYRSVLPRTSATHASQILLANQIDITTFTSSSTVQNLVSMLGKDWEAVNRTRVACIGQVTAATATRLGVRVDVVAKEHTIPGLVQSIIEDCQKNRGIS